jgi:tetratricopeptide (TPR) repeat protein
MEGVMAKRRRAAILASLFFVWGALVSEAFGAGSFEERLRALEPTIGHYPAEIKDKNGARAVKAQYEALKKDLDAALASRPKEEKLLYQRGYLQSMGHNFDYPGAWEGATADLKAALKINPNDVPAILALANLWVNSRPDLSPNAEGLYRAAQCNMGEKPLEEAQRGLFFALYYQGRIKDAYAQAQYLKQTWPNNSAYGSLLETARSVLLKKSEPLPEAPIRSALASCSDKAH